jgi:predicted transcriptional regulator
MTLREIKEILEAEILCGEDHLNEEVGFAGGSDMMSDVLAFGKPGILLLTGLTNAQSVRTADIIEAKAIVYVRGKRPDKEGIELARQKGIPILSTHFMMYKTCGLLYKKGLPGVSEIK